MWHHALNEEGVAIGSGVVEGGLQGPRCAAPEALGHALAERLRIGGSDHPCPEQARTVRTVMGRIHGRPMRTSQPQHQLFLTTWQLLQDINRLHAGLTASHIHHGGTQSTQFPQSRWTRDTKGCGGRAVRRLHKNLHQ